MRGHSAFEQKFRLQSEGVTFRGKRVNIGARGSGTPGLFMRLLNANQIDREEITRSLATDQEAVIGLIEGKLDAIVLIAAPEAAYVQMLLQTPGVRLYEFAQAESYARRYRYMSPVTLPRLALVPVTQHHHRAERGRAHASYFLPVPALDQSDFCTSV